MDSVVERDLSNSVMFPEDECSTFKQFEIIIEEFEETLRT